MPFGTGYGPAEQRQFVRRGNGLDLHAEGFVDIHYARLVVSPACFARAESRSSLSFDSNPPPRLCRADEQPLSAIRTAES